MKFTIVGLGGSLRPASTSLAALKIALAAAADDRTETVCLDIHALNLPLYQPGQSMPEAVAPMIEAIRGAHGMLWCSPLYHGTVSGSFKNAVDWMEFLSGGEHTYLNDKIIGLISVAGGTQGLQAINTMEYMVRSLRGWAVPLVIPIPHAGQVFNEQGEATDAAVRRSLQQLGQEVNRAVKQFHRTGQCDYDSASRTNYAAPA